MLLGLTSLDGQRHAVPAAEAERCDPTPHAAPLAGLMKRFPQGRYVPMDQPKGTSAP